MSLRQQIQDELKQSMREKDAEKTSTLRLLSAALSEKQRQKRQALWQKNPNLTEEEFQEKTALSDEEVREIVVSEVKKRNEAAKEFERGARPDLARKEQAEAQLLQVYLPPQLSEEDLHTIVMQTIKEVGASS